MQDVRYTLENGYHILRNAKTGEIVKKMKVTKHNAFSGFGFLGHVSLQKKKVENGL